MKNRFQCGRETLDTLPDPDLTRALTAAGVFPPALTPAVRAAMNPADPGDPLRIQFLPSAAELHVSAEESSDPLQESGCMPVPGLIHKYANRVLILATERCAVHCRFCFRKSHHQVTPAPPLSLPPILDYIRSRPEISEVILSGGDPLVITDGELSDILHSLNTIPHVRTLRIHSRVPVVMPDRITPELISMLQQLKPVWMVVHINHFAELTADSVTALSALADAGIPVLSQTVLLRGVNDSAGTLQALCLRLAELRVRPYYLHLLDPAPGTAHFRVTDTDARHILDELRSRIQGYAVPTLVRDSPGARGKIIEG